MNTKENILNRRSIRKFKNEAVDQSLIDQIIEAGLYAPSARGSQSSIIIQIKDEKVKEELLHDKNFLLQIESSMKRMDEKTVCEPREDGGMEESESGLDMDVDMMLDGLEMFEMDV